MLRIAQMTGLHLEGPFITVKGAHDGAVLAAPGPRGFEALIERYGFAVEDNATTDGSQDQGQSDEKDAGSASGRRLDTSHVAIVTLAPEVEGALDAVARLSRRGITVSLGHSTASLAQTERVVDEGATLVTHLFNAMKPFHHRDPGLIGVLGSSRPIDYSIIADGIHAHPASVRIAMASHPEGLILVTDAIAAMGLGNGTFKLGEVTIEIADGHAHVAGTDTLAGAVVTMEQCVQNLKKFTGCSAAQAVLAATKVPARRLGMYPRKGSLAHGADADVLLLDPETLKVRATIKNGQVVYVDGPAFPPPRSTPTPTPATTSTTSSASALLR